METIILSEPIRPCLLGSAVFFLAKEQYFSLTTNQRTVLFSLPFQQSEDLVPHGIYIYTHGAAQAMTGPSRCSCSRSCRIQARCAARRQRFSLALEMLGRG
jgi:hypothetical protein